MAHEASTHRPIYMPISCSQKQQEEDIKVGDIVERDIDGILFPAKVRPTVRIHGNDGMWSNTAEQGRLLGPLGDTLVVVGGCFTKDSLYFRRRRPMRRFLAALL